MPWSTELEHFRQLYRDGAVVYRDGNFDFDHDRLRTSRSRRGVPPYLRGGAEEQIDIYSGYLEAMRRIRAEEIFKAAWNARGGPMSSLGLPINGKISVEGNGTALSAAFRSGSMHLLDHETRLVEKTERMLHVSFVGLECNVRQEKADELYGVVGVIGPANRQIMSYSFPGGDGTITMGPDGQRFWNAYQELYSGPVEDVVLVAALVEHDDFADVDAAARQIADKIAEAGGQLLGALTGVPAEAAADNTWFKDGLGEVLGVVMGGIFGMGDDPYPGQSLRVPWEEIGQWGPPRQMPRTRGDDPKTIKDWTHRVKVTGRDDGGDLGDYDFYFDMWVEQKSDERQEHVPH